MKALVKFCQWFVGLLFIFSGLIKLNDPLGFSYKLNDYFAANVLNLEFLQPFTLVMAIIIVVFEVVVGVMLLIGFQKKFTLWSLLLMIVFFTFLTGYTYLTGYVPADTGFFEFGSWTQFNKLQMKVSDCGCFGDAIPLTPLESFWKDVILLVMIVILFLNHRFIVPLFAKAKLKYAVLLTSIFCFAIAYWVLMHLPILDFRAYKVGTNIEEGMAEDPDRPDVYAYDWYYNIDGKEEIVTTDGLPPEGYGKYDKVEPRIIEEGYVPPIHDFSIERNGEDFTIDMLSKEKVAVIVTYNLDKSEADGMYKLNAFIDRAETAGYEVIALSASPETQAAELMRKYGFETTFYVTDETALKTIVRSNPGIMLMDKGTITAKSHWNDIEDLNL